MNNLCVYVRTLYYIELENRDPSVVSWPAIEPTIFPKIQVTMYNYRAIVQLL